MVEDLTNCVGIIKYTLSTGEQVEITSNMSEKEIVSIQAQFWRSYGHGFHPSKRVETQAKINPKHKNNNHHQKFNQHH